MFFLSLSITERVCFSTAPTRRSGRTRSFCWAEPYTRIGISYLHRDVITLFLLLLRIRRCGSRKNQFIGRHSIVSTALMCPSRWVRFCTTIIIIFVSIYVYKSRRSVRAARLTDFVCSVITADLVRNDRENINDVTRQRKIFNA